MRYTITMPNAAESRRRDVIRAQLQGEPAMWVISRVDGCTLHVRRPRFYERAWWWLRGAVLDAVAWVRAWAETRRLIRFLRRTK